MSAPAIAGAGGYVMPPCLMRSVVSWKGRSKPMTSTTLRAIRDKPRRAGRKRWDANHGVAARNASPEGSRRQRPARDHRVGQPPRGCRPPGDPRFYGEDGTEGRRYRDANGESTLYRLGQQLSGLDR